MATTEAVTPAKTAPPTAPTDKRRPGRPTKEEAEAKRMAEAHAPDDGDEATDFFSWLKTFNDQEWGEFLFMYLYRRKPITDRKLTGNDIYVTKYVKPVDPQDILEEHGSGEYKLQLNRYVPAIGKSKREGNHVFKLLNEKYPPKIPLGEWIDDDRNKEWWWAKPALVHTHGAAMAAANGTAPPFQQQQPQQDPAALLNTVVGIVKQLNPNKEQAEQRGLADRVISAMQDSQREMLAASSPEKQLNLINSIIAAIRPAKSEGIDPAIQMLMDELKHQRAESAEERKYNRELMAKQNTPAPQKSVREELRDILEIAEEIRGPGKSAGSTGWDVAREVGIELLKVVSTVGTAIAMRGGFKPAPVTTTSANAGAIEGARTEPPTAEEQEMLLKQMNQAYGPMLDEVAPHLVDRFLSEDGHAFREWFIREYGNRAYDALRTMDTRTIQDLFKLRLAQAAPAIQAELAKVQPPEEFVRFIEEFKSDPPADDEDEDTTETPAAPSGVAKREF